MLKLGRFIVDTHVHAQRHAAGKALKGLKEYSDLGHAMFEIEAYENSTPSPLRHGVLWGGHVRPRTGLWHDQRDKRRAGKKISRQVFVCSCQAKATRDKALRGEIKWTMDAACEELDALLGTGNFVGIGECMPDAPGQPQRSQLRGARRAHHHQGHDEGDGCCEEAEQFRFVITRAHRVDMPLPTMDSRRPIIPCGPIPSQSLTPTCPSY